MSIFEAVMLLCFGAAWPFSIIKSYRSGSNSGKSIVFLFIVLLGYASGITNKLLYNNDKVLILYVINACMVLCDIAIFYRNNRVERHPD